MGHTQGWVPISEVVSNYLDRSEQGITKYSKCWHICHSGMQQLGLDFFYTVRSAQLVISPTRTAALPPDFLKYTKIGVFNNRGEVIPWIVNNSLSTFSDLQPNRLAQINGAPYFDNYTFGGNVWCNYWNGSAFGNLYGLPSGAPYAGSFKIDTQNGIILLGDDFTYAALCIEYIASPEETGEYYVPIEFSEALLWYIAWNDISFLGSTRRGSLGDVANRRNNWFNERRLARARYKPTTAGEMIQISLENQRLTVKG